MRKIDLAKEIHLKTGIEIIAVEAIINEFMGTVKDTMIDGENVYLRGFGTFELVERKEKTGRNISKNAAVTIPAHKVPYFKPCKEFKNMVK